MPNKFRLFFLCYFWCLHFIKVLKQVYNQCLKQKCWMVVLILTPSNSKLSWVVGKMRSLRNKREMAAYLGGPQSLYNFFKSSNMGATPPAVPQALSMVCRHGILYGCWERKKNGPWGKWDAVAGTLNRSTHVGGGGYVAIICCRSHLLPAIGNSGWLSAYVWKQSRRSPKNSEVDSASLSLTSLSLSPILV